MPRHRPDRVIRFLTALATIAYVGTWVGGAVVLTGAPLLKLFAGSDLDWQWGLPVPAAVPDAETTVSTTWGAAALAIEDARGVLRLPIAIIPWWLFGVLWAHTALAFGLALRMFQHLRRFFRRVRDGAPFDAQNAIRLRAVGLLLLALGLLNGLAQLVTSLAVQRAQADGGIVARGGLHFEMPLLLVALVVISLAEIFRRGAELEHEQSLVV